MPPNVAQQAARRQAILALLKQHRVSRQGELVRLLAQRGFPATQSSVR